MKQKIIRIFYAYDNIDGEKTTLFVVDGKATKEMISEALIDFDDYLLSDGEERFNEEVERAYNSGECSFGDTEFFFDLVTMYSE